MYGEVVLETLFVFNSTFLEMEDISVAQCAAMRNGQEALQVAVVYEEGWMMQWSTLGRLAASSFSVKGRQWHRKSKICPSSYSILCPIFFSEEMDVVYQTRVRFQWSPDQRFLFGFHSVVRVIFFCVSFCRFFVNSFCLCFTLSCLCRAPFHGSSHGGRRTSCLCTVSWRHPPTSWSVWAAALAKPALAHQTRRSFVRTMAMGTLACHTGATYRSSSRARPKKRVRQEAGWMEYACSPRCVWAAYW